MSTLDYRALERIARPCFYEWMDPAEPDTDTTVNSDGLYALMEWPGAAWLHVRLDDGPEPAIVRLSDLYDDLRAPRHVFLLLFYQIRNGRVAQGVEVEDEAGLDAALRIVMDAEARR